MSLPLPDLKQVSNLRRNLAEYVILALAGAVVWLFVAFMNLNNYVRTDLLQRQLRNEKALESASRATNSFLDYQRFRTPIRPLPDLDTLP